MRCCAFFAAPRLVRPVFDLEHHFRRFYSDGSMARIDRTSAVGHPPTPRVVDVILPAPPSIVETPETPDPQAGNRELVGVLRQLRSNLPQGLKYLVPVPNHDADLSWLYQHDFEELLEKLRLPRFDRPFVSPAWEKHFAPHCESKVSIALALSMIFEANAEPMTRAGDVQQAAWCVLFLLPELGASRVSVPHGAADEPVIEPTRLAQLLREHGDRIREAVKPIIAQKSAHAWNPQSALRTLGYRVGNSGRPTPFRRGVLRDALLLPADLISAERRAVWGAPGTRHRLRTIERLLCLFRDLASGKDADMSKAIEQWNSDLAWLAGEYGSARI